MKIDDTAKTSASRIPQAGFTLIEVAFAAAIAALVLAGMFEGYNMAGRRSQYSACSLAASAAATRQLEQVLSAHWIPSTGTIELFQMNGATTNILCLPTVSGNVIPCTNVTSVTQVPGPSPYALVQVDCVWTFPVYGGVYTNTVAVLRAPD
jgi:prepilin-type N-terminal cleavage/methylation domain-containing protein